MDFFFFCLDFRLVSLECHLPVFLFCQKIFAIRVRMDNNGGYPSRIVDSFTFVLFSFVCFVCELPSSRRKTREIRTNFLAEAPILGSVTTFIQDHIPCWIIEGSRKQNSLDFVFCGHSSRREMVSHLIKIVGWSDLKSFVVQLF